MFLSIGIGVKRFGSVVSGIIKKNLQAWFDFKKADVIGAELIKGGSFDSGDFGLFTVAVNGTGVVSVVSIDGGYGVRIQNPVADSSPANLNYLNALVVGETYELTYRIVDNSEGLIYIWISVPAVDFPQEVGTHTITFTVPTGSSTTLVFNRTGGGLVDITITDISLKRVSQFVKDKSPNTNKAELFTGKALEFNGNDSVVLDGFTSSGDTFTFAFWAKATASAVSYILDANSPRFVIMYNYSVLTVHSGSASVTFGAMQLNQFNRVAVVVNGTSVTAYVDGVQFGTTQTIALVDMSSITDLTLGSKYDSSTAFFSGSLSDFQIYNEAWIQSDVTFDYNNPNHLVTDNPNTTIALSNLKGYWALSEGSGSIAYDSSGGGNNGTITGATYDDQQPTIPQLGLMDWAKSTPVSTEVTLIQAPNNKGYDILGNSLRLRERGFNLDGSGYSSVVMSSELTAITNGTIQFWLKNSKSTTFVMFNETTTTNYLGAWNGSGDFYNDSASGTVTQYADDNSTVTSTKITDGTWHLYTFTGVDLSLFNEFQISNYSTSSSIWLDCIIDEVTIYDRVLTSKEITNNYKVGLNAHKVGSAFSTEFSSEFGF